MTLKTLLLSKGERQITCQEQGTGEPFVLIHGVGMQSAAWAPQFAALAQSYRVIALDMPGHGQSDPLPANSRLEDYVAWCHDAITALDLGPVNLAGHSMGALIAAGYAIKHAKMVKRVALLNGVYRRDETSKVAVIARATLIHSGQVDLETPLSRWFGEAPHELAARGQVATWLRDVDVGSYATAYTAFAHGDNTYADRFVEIACPFLALTGADDPNSTPNMSEAMAKQVPDGRAVTINGHKHMVNLTAAEEVNAHLVDWLKLPIKAKETL